MGVVINNRDIIDSRHDLVPTTNTPESRQRTSRSLRVVAKFAQQGDDPEVLRRVAEEADVEVVDDLLLESLGSGADGYVEMMETSTAKIVTALGGR